MIGLPAGPKKTQTTFLPKGYFFLDFFYELPLSYLFFLPFLSFQLVRILILALYLRRNVHERHLFFCFVFFFQSFFGLFCVLLSQFFESSFFLNLLLVFFSPSNNPYLKMLNTISCILIQWMWWIGEWGFLCFERFFLTYFFLVFQNYYPYDEYMLWRAFKCVFD